MAFDTQDTNTIVTLHSSGGQGFYWWRMAVNMIWWMDDLVKEGEKQFGDVESATEMEKERKYSKEE